MQKTINSAVAFLAKEQQADGSFLCMVTEEFDNYSKGKAVIVPAIVPTNIVLSSLHMYRDNPVARQIQDKAAAFLLEEKGSYWSFNYWFKKSDWFTKEPYPDDTDDTFCALAALYEYNPDLFDGEVMAKIVTMLTSCESQEGGPYDMWLVPPTGREKWNDLDLVCNANISYFLHLNDISLPKLNEFIESAIDAKDYVFPYNTVYPGMYFVSRFYHGKKVGLMARQIVAAQEQNGAWENPLRTALAISTLINLKGLRYRAEIEKGIKYLRKSQNKNGSWNAASFYYQMRLKEKTLFAGSASTTTALCLEALKKYEDTCAQASRKQVSAGIAAQELSPKEKRITAAVMKKYTARFSAGSPEWGARAVAMAQRVLASNPDIVLLPYFFREMVMDGNTIPDATIVDLGLANLYGWIAYTVYDDFLDDEGVPTQLPLANLCLREASKLFTLAYGTYAEWVFDIIDEANDWEVRNCRDVESLPDYGDLSQLAHKSLGHALGPVAILGALGHTEESHDLRNFMDFFKHYLIARQLNDDAHDWEDDLKGRQVSAVVAKLLKHTKGKSHTPEELRVIFWNKTVVAVSKDMLAHCARARKSLARISCLHNTTLFSKMLEHIEQSATKALDERTEAMKFLKTYRMTAKKL